MDQPVSIELSEAEIQRYARHILLAEVGGLGQMQLKRARVLIIGAGGLGSPLLLYLAAAGVGTLGLIDDDRVELSNLQRQIAHGTAAIGELKVMSAAAAAAAINPLVQLQPHPCRLTPANMDALFAEYDIICDGSDNFQTRFAVSDGCLRAGKTLVSASVLRFEGQLATFKPHTDQNLPCYRCLYPAPPPPEDAPSCAAAGVMGAITGVMGTLAANEVCKEILGIGESLAGRLLIWDALATRFRVIRLPRDPQCGHHG